MTTTTTTAPPAGMSAQEATEIYQLVRDLFPGVTQERAYRVRIKLVELGLHLGSAREVVYQHRETHEFLTEPHLYDTAGEAVGRLKKADEIKAAAGLARKLQREEWQRWENDARADAARTEATLRGFTRDQLGELKAAALVQQPDLVRKKLESEDPLQNVVLGALIRQHVEHARERAEPQPSH